MDLVMRLENFTSGLGELRRLTGLQLPDKAHENPSGDRTLKQMYFDAIYADLKTLCAVCKVYAQDFTCLGYVRPSQCTQQECSSVGIDLEA